MRCPFCHERIKKGAVKCKHCHSVLDDSQDVKDGMNYLKNGFAKIEETLDGIEAKVNVITGMVFRHHKYSASDLINSADINKVKAFAGKIKDDVERWESAGQLTFRLKLLYNQKSQELQDRLAKINRMIQEREPTVWEKVGSFFRQLFSIVLEVLPLFFHWLLPSPLSSKRLTTASKKAV
jgi:hypothetical protein